MSYFKIGQRVRVKRDIFRAEDPQNPYSREGEQGEILEIFRPIPTGGGEVKALCAKVRVEDGSIRTLRLTSLEAIPEIALTSGEMVPNKKQQLNVTK